MPNPHCCAQLGFLFFAPYPSTAREGGAKKKHKPTGAGDPCVCCKSHSFIVRFLAPRLGNANEYIFISLALRRQ